MADYDDREDLNLLQQAASNLGRTMDSARGDLKKFRDEEKRFKKETKETTAEIGDLAEATEELADGLDKTTKKAGVVEKALTGLESTAKKAIGSFGGYLENIIGPLTAIGTLTYAARKQFEYSRVGLQRYLTSITDVAKAAKQLEGKPSAFGTLFDDERTVTGRLSKISKAYKAAINEAAIDTGLLDERMETIGEEAANKFRMLNTMNATKIRTDAKKFLLEMSKLERAGVMDSEEVLETYYNLAYEHGVGVVDYYKTASQYYKKIDKILDTSKKEYGWWSDAIAKSVMKAVDAQDGYYRSIENVNASMQASLEIGKKYYLSQKETTGLFEWQNNLFKEADTSVQMEAMRKVINRAQIAGATEEHGGGGLRGQLSFWLKEMGGNQKMRGALLRSGMSPEEFMSAAIATSQGKETALTRMGLTTEDLNVAELRKALRAAQGTVKGGTLSTTGGMIAGKGAFLQSVGGTNMMLRAMLETAYSKTGGGTQGAHVFEQLLPGMDETTKNIVAHSMLQGGAGGKNIITDMMEQLDIANKEQKKERDTQKSSLDKLAESSDELRRALEPGGLLAKMASAIIENNPLIVAGLGLLSAFVMNRLAAETGDEVERARSERGVTGFFRKRIRGMGKTGKAGLVGAGTGIASYLGYAPGAEKGSLREAYTSAKAGFFGTKAYQNFQEGNYGRAFAYGYFTKSNVEKIVTTLSPQSQKIIKRMKASGYSKEQIAEVAAELQQQELNQPIGRMKAIPGQLADYGRQISSGLVSAEMWARGKGKGALAHTPGFLGGKIESGRDLLRRTGSGAMTARHYLHYGGMTPLTGLLGLYGKTATGLADPFQAEEVKLGRVEKAGIQLGQNIGPLTKTYFDAYDKSATKVKNFMTSLVSAQEDSNQMFLDELGSQQAKTAAAMKEIFGKKHKLDSKGITSDGKIMFEMDAKPILEVMDAASKQATNKRAQQ